MPLETATYVADLNSANPAATDGLNQSDDHARLIKATIKNTFPNFTSAALNATQAALDAAAVAVDSGVSVLADTGAHFKTNTKDGLENPSAGKVSVVAVDGSAAKQTVVEFTGADKGAAFKGPVSAAGAYSGGTGQLVPIGAVLEWYDDVLPTEGGYAWANGQVIASANVICPVLLARWGSRFGGNGVTTMGVPNRCETVAVGKGTMGGATSPGLLASISAGVKNVVGSLFGSDTKTLARSDLPNANVPVTITEPNGGAGHDHPFSQNLIGYIPSAGTVGFTSGSGLATNVNGTTGKSPTGITAAFNMNGNVTQTNVGIVQPSIVCNYILRIG